MSKPKASERWVFTSARMEATIVVEDANSAKSLGSVLALLGQAVPESDWTVAHERAQAAMSMPPPLPQLPPLPQFPLLPKMDSRTLPAAPKLSVVPAPDHYEDRRKHKRFNKKIRVILISQSRTYRTFTDNVSLGGLALKTQIPAHFLEGLTHVLLGRADSKENIAIECVMISDQRLQFQNASDIALGTLGAWIDADPDLANSKSFSGSGRPKLRTKAA